MKRFSLRAYLQETGQKVLVAVLVLGALLVVFSIVWTLIAVVAWMMGDLFWGTLGVYLMWAGIVYLAACAVVVPCTAIVTIPAVPRAARRLRTGVLKTKDRLLHRRRIANGSGTVRDLAALGSLGRAGRSAVHRVLRPPPPPIWPEKPRWLGLTVRGIRYVGRGIRHFAAGFTSMLWQSVTFIAGVLLSWEWAREAGIIPREWYLTILPWVAIPVTLLVSIWMGIHRIRNPLPPDEPVLLVGVVKARGGAPAASNNDSGTKDGMLRAHYDRPQRKEIEVNVRCAVELHADGSVSPCRKLCGIQKIRCTPSKARSVLDLERVVLICQRKPGPELNLIDRLAHFATRHGVHPLAGDSTEVVSKAR